MIEDIQTSIVASRISRIEKLPSDSDVRKKMGRYPLRPPKEIKKPELDPASSLVIIKSSLVHARTCSALSSIGPLRFNGLAPSFSFRVGKWLDRAGDKTYSLRGVRDLFKRLEYLETHGNHVLVRVILDLEIEAPVSNHPLELSATRLQ